VSHKTNRLLGRRHGRRQLQPHPALEAAGHRGGEAELAWTIMAKAHSVGVVGATIGGFYITQQFQITGGNIQEKHLINRVVCGFSLLPCCVMVENCSWCFQKP